MAIKRKLRPSQAPISTSTSSTTPTLNTYQETTFVNSNSSGSDDEEDFKNNQATYLAVIADVEAVSDKAIALKCKEFIKQDFNIPAVDEMNDDFKFASTDNDHILKVGEEKQISTQGLKKMLLKEDEGWDTPEVDDEIYNTQPMDAVHSRAMLETHKPFLIYRPKPYASIEFSYDAYHVFDEMVNRGVKPNNVTFFTIISCARPCSEIRDMLSKESKVSARLLQRIRDRVQRWYHEEGYTCAQVVNFGNLITREVVCEVVEGDITNLSIQYLDKLGNVVEGNTEESVVSRKLPEQLLPGHTFNIEAGKQALRNINSMALFSNIEVSPQRDVTNEGSIIVEIKLK